MAEIGKLGRKGSAKQKKEGAKRAKAVRGSGLERLRKAADRRVARNSNELADLLLANALQGKLDSARMLVKLAEDKEAREDQRKEKEEDDDWDGPSISEMLQMERDEREAEERSLLTDETRRKRGLGEPVGSSGDDREAA